MRFDVRYRTLISYEELAVDSHNEVRARPAATPYQKVIDYSLQIAPPSSTRTFTDGWGTTVESFGIRLPHIAMEVIAEATVETTKPPEVTALVSLDGLTDLTFVDEHYEFLSSTPATTASPPMVELAKQLRANATHVLGLVTSLQEAVAQHLEYRTGSTSVTTTAAEAFGLGSGVCQDHAHVMVTLARLVGLPARYVSGYFFTAADSDGTDSEDDLVTVQTHAWVEVAIPRHRWLAMDPTNGLIPGERHVKIGHGPDYASVMPFRGTFVGPESSEVTASVQIRRRSHEAAEAPPEFSTTSEADLRFEHARDAFDQDQQQHQQQQQ